MPELRGGMQPTPLMIFRELERSGSLVVGGAPSPAAQAAAVTAAATAAVGPEGVAATPPKKLRRNYVAESAVSHSHRQRSVCPSSPAEVLPRRLLSLKHSASPGQSAIVLWHLYSLALAGLALSRLADA